MRGALCVFQKRWVIETACQIADEQGLNSLSLKAVAEKLNVRTPSLYNHIESLDDLLREVAHKGMRSMNEQMAQELLESPGDTALKGVSVEYLNFIIEHPGVYETIQWATWHGTEETAQIFGNYIKILSTIISSYNFPSESTNEILNLFTDFFMALPLCKCVMPFLIRRKSEMSSVMRLVR